MCLRYQIATKVSWKLLGKDSKDFDTHYNEYQNVKTILQFRKVKQRHQIKNSLVIFDLEHSFPVL